MSCLVKFGDKNAMSKIHVCVACSLVEMLRYRSMSITKASLSVMILNSMLRYSLLTTI